MRRLAPAAILLLAASPVLAHSDHGGAASLSAGLSHPLTGTDHLLAMVAVGLVAAVAGGAARLAFPAAFVAAMATGLLLGASGLRLPAAEPLILASILVLAALLGLAARPPAAGGAVMAALFGLAHGSAHGVEAGDAALLPFALGVLGATLALHALGLGLAGALQRLLGRADARLPLRFLGGGLGLGGVALALG